MIRRGALLALAAAFAFASGSALAAPLDGTKPLVCTFEGSVACDSDAICGTVEAGDMDLPESIQVDFEGRRLRSQDGQRTSPIGLKNVSDSVLIAQGNQNGRGWSITIDRASGAMTGTIAEADGAFVVFGNCKDAP